MTNTSPDFYRLMGPLLSRRHIVKEIGGPIWDDDGKQWWTALLGGKVAGFAAARDNDRRITFQSAYVLPEHRRNGLYRTLFYARMEAFPGRPIRAVCTTASLPMFLANGFTAAYKRGSFTEVHYDG